MIKLQLIGSPLASIAKVKKLNIMRKVKFCARPNRQEYRGPHELPCCEVDEIRLLSLSRSLARRFTIFLQHYIHTIGRLCVNYGKFIGIISLFSLTNELTILRAHSMTARVRNTTLSDVCKNKKKKQHQKSIFPCHQSIMRQQSGKHLGDSIESTCENQQHRREERAAT